MDMLLDTHMAIWLLNGSPRLPQAARQLALNADNRLFVSDASAWEIAIKRSKRPDKISFTCRDFLDGCETAGYETLAISRAAILEYGQLDTERADPVHRDPFDRMLIAQSKARNMPLVTHDRLLALYGEPLVMIL